MAVKTARKLYEGWRGARNYSGQATWNVVLWLNNDEGLYRSMVYFVRQHHNAGGRITAAFAEETVRELMPDGTPDWQDKDVEKMYRQVHWASVARSMKEDL